jgi:hypothetical protein
VARRGRNDSGRRCPVVGRRALRSSSTDGGEDKEEELDEAAAMSLTGGGDELNESDVGSSRTRIMTKRTRTVGRCLTRRPR